MVFFLILFSLLKINGDSNFSKLSFLQQKQVLPSSKDTSEIQVHTYGFFDGTTC